MLCNFRSRAGKLADTNSRKPFFAETSAAFLHCTIACRPSARSTDVKKMFANRNRPV
jgi:hypothetical protein